MKFTKKNLDELLSSANWFEGRNVSGQFSDSPLFEILPEKIIAAFSEYGDLKISQEVFVNEIEIKLLEFVNLNIERIFRDPKVLEYYKENMFDPKSGIKNDKWSTESDIEFYYSVLIGTQLYFISDMMDSNALYMDASGNVYMITFLNDLVWIDNNFRGAISKLFFGKNESYIFIAPRMVWNGKDGDIKADFLPVNKYLNEKNPWSIN